MSKPGIRYEQKLWAINSGNAGLLGVFWFDHYGEACGHPCRKGNRIALFKTRKLARESVEYCRSYFKKAHCVRVYVTIQQEKKS